MRKKVFGRQFSRGKKGREAMFRSLLRALILDGKIVTTYAKAKSIIGQADKLVTMAKGGTLSSRRRVLAYLANDRGATDKFFREVVPALSDRASGYTKYVNLPPRLGDASPMMRIEWTNSAVVSSESKKESKKAGKSEQSGPTSAKASDNAKAKSDKPAGEERKDSKSSKSDKADKKPVKKSV